MTYECAMCGGTIEEVTPEADMLEEMRGHFGEVPESERVIVCDDCYKAMDPATHPEEVQAAIQKLRQ